MATPSSKWRTIWPRIVPSITWTPMAGLTSISMAAPDSDRSMMRHGYWRPSVSCSDADRVARRDALVAAVFGQVEFVLVGEPGELGCEFVALALRGNDRHGEAIRQGAGDDAFDAADMVDIGNDLLARHAGAFRAEGDVAGGHVDDLAGMLGAVLEHESAINLNANALKVPPFCP